MTDPENMSFNRRIMLQGAASGLMMSLGHVSVFGSFLKPIASQIVDTHTHFYDPDRPQGVPWPNPNNPLLYRTVLPAEFKKLSKAFGVTGTVIVEASPWVEDNQWLLDLAQDDPFILGIVGNLAIDQPEFSKHLERFDANDLYRGIRVRAIDLDQPDNNDLIDQNLQDLAERELSLDLLGRSQSLSRINAIAKRWPNLHIVLDHLPYQLPAKADQARQFEQELKELAQLPNVFAKVSHVLWKSPGIDSNVPALYEDRLEEVWEMFGIDRVVYGSNWPVSDSLGTYAEVFQVVAEFVRRFDQPAIEKYFWKNSQMAYRWKPRTK